MITSTHAPRLRGLLLVLAVLMAAPFATAQAVIGGSLLDALSSASPLSSLEVVVTYDQEGPLTVAQQSALAGLVGGGRFFQSLPIAGAIATPAQVAQIAALPGVLSVWLNEELHLHNDGSRQITGVDKLRADATLRTSTGLPFSGQGVAVLVNDSGIDATHADLPYGTKVLENVQALTNLNAVVDLAPITYIEGTPNTDTNSGHGTHCAGTVAGLGVRSGGLYEGVAPGASLIGYGSGGVILILDGLGGFDYAITHQFSFADPIRVITNSWGSDGEFAPESPIVQASYRAYQRGINVLFAASNSGPGEDTHNIYAQAPWVLSVGAGDKLGALADFSSRGRKGEGYDFQTYDGQTWTYRNDVSLVAPGVDIISTRSATNAGANGGEADLGAIAPAHLPFYTMISGTSMATPHTAGIVALLLEADPSLQPDDVKRILQTTATNMPGREAWEVGAGYVNAHAAVAHALGYPTGSLALVNAFRDDFTTEALLVDGDSFERTVFFSPVGEPETATFEVGEGVALVKARAVVSENTVAIVLTDPAGNRYGSGITLPLLGEIAGVTAPGMAGTWTYSVSGIGGVSGIGLDPLGVTNGTALPGNVTATITFVEDAGFRGIDDVEGHPAQRFIEAAVMERLVDGRTRRMYKPDNRLSRADLAQYLVMGAGVRQPAPADVLALSGVAAQHVDVFEAVTARGAALKDRTGFAAGLLAMDGGADPDGSVSRQELAYSLIAALGLHGAAEGYTGGVFASYDGRRVRLGDSDQIDAAFRGYVQLALDAGLLNAQFGVSQGPFDLEPTITATFGPRQRVLRGEYAVAAVRMFDAYDSVDPDAVSTGGTSAMTVATPLAQASSSTADFGLMAPAPNPAAAQSRIAFSLATAGPARLAVYDVLGREVAVLADGEMAEGAHTASLDARSLASGTYVVRLNAGAEAATRQLTVVR